MGFPLILYLMTQVNGVKKAITQIIKFLFYCHIIIYWEKVIVSCKTWNHPKTAQTPEKPPANQPIRFLPDFYLFGYDILFYFKVIDKQNLNLYFPCYAFL